MKSTIILIFLLTLNSSFCFSQIKTKIGILPFTYTGNPIPEADVKLIQETISNIFLNTQRFSLIENEKLDCFKKEKYTQKIEDFSDGTIDATVISKANSIGADFLLSGHIYTADAESVEKKDFEGNYNVFYKAKITLKLKLINISKSQIFSTETLESKTASSSLFGTNGSTTPNQAITKAAKGFEEKILEFVNKSIVVSIPIVEIQEKDANSNATKILIAGGSSMGLKKGDKLKVVELNLIEVDGKKLERRKEIGDLKIIKVEDDNFSVCSVVSGGVEINSKFESKSKLIVFINKN